jgi:uncharacterized protein YgiM (DUF1202 family)
MSKPAENVGPKAIRAAIGVVLLVVVVMVVLNYWGTYRSSKGSDPGSTETTASAEGTASTEATASPEGGEAAEGEAAAAEAEPSQGTVIVLIDGLNFRTTPSKSGDLIAGLDKDTKLAYISTEDGWYKVRTSDGKTGYVSSSEQYTELQK